ncbi:glucose-1-phosphate cytidylyltransferase [Alphaproteobacteria bacterium]|nr:glucose-1-phosphate cytidylyltransferase [Alphaproteobacteria bacterium]
MKVLILAGGFGTRLSEDTQIKPKPMIEIGGKPILWHIMKTYSQHGFNDFVILLGYKGHLIKEYFSNYFQHQSDMTVNLNDGSIEFLNKKSEPWKITLLDTGLDTMTGGRIKRSQDYIGDEPFMLTYGDGVGDININDLVKFHKAHGKAVTMTSSQPEGRFGAIDIDQNNKVNKFQEKIKGDGGWINAGFFVCEPKVFDYINDGDKTIFEQNPLTNLVEDNELYAYKHYGFWQPMDTPRDKIMLRQLIETGNAPWVTWDK